MHAVGMKNRTSLHSVYVSDSNPGGHSQKDEGGHDESGRRGSLCNGISNRPQDHLYFKNNIRFRAKENDDLGDTTISTLDLNNQEKHIQSRLSISQEIATKVEDLKEKSKLVISGNRTGNRFKYKLCNDVRALLELCRPTTPYSAVKATTLTHDEYYVQLKNNLSRCGLWHKDFNELERLINEISYDIDA